MVGIPLERLEASIRALPAVPGAPKYLRVSEAFERCIRAGDFAPGARVPAEAELAARLPVGLGTLQRAMGRLAARGLIVRRRRAGTFIADRASRVSEVYVYRFRDPGTGRHLMPYVRALAISRDEAPGPWRTFLGAERVVRIDRLVWVADDPPAFSSVFLAHAHGAHLLGMPVEELDGASVHRVLVETFNLPTLRMEHRIACRALSERATAHLSLAAGTSGLVWDVMDFSFEDVPNMFQRFEMPPGHRPMELAEALPTSPAPGPRGRRAGKTPEPEE